ncbi:MAG: hypothetical protein HWE22_18425 [Flavobacteriales bacterium]|nr:hypothetical protein [Flavobacteriales bacterium]
MKLLTFLGFFFLSCSAIYAQDIDERLLSRYSQEELHKLIESDIDQYNLLEYALDNALYVANYDGAKGGDFKLISVNVESLPTFLDLNLHITDQNQYYKIEGKDKLLVVKSTSVLMYEMKK